LGLSAGALALGGGIAGLFGGGGANSVQLPPQFNMPNMAGAANNAYSGIGNLGQYNTYAPNIGQVQGITSNLVNNPYAGQFQQGANTSGGMNQAGGLSAFGSGMNLQGAGNQVLNTAFDPQNALYNQQLQQTLGQQGALNAAAGVGTTPYGAGLQDQNLQNFNIAWQNNQLGREATGLSAAGGAYQQGQGLTQAGAGQYLGGAGTPYQTYQGIGSGQIGNLGTLGQFGQSAAQLPQQSIADYLSYLGAGNQAGGVANQQAQTALDQNQMQYNQNLGYGQMIGGGLASLGNQGYGIGGSGWGNLAAML
jgi:hypothetical protein